MTDYADLEIRISHDHGDSYRVNLRLQLPYRDTDIEPLGYEPALIEFNTNLLGELADQHAEYGQILSETIFGVDSIKTFFSQARAAAASSNSTLRVRLYIERSAKMLHGLRWETLRDPEPGTSAFLLINETIPFSRYLSSDDWRPESSRPKENLKALVVIANPINLDGWNLDEVQVADELKRTLDFLGEIPVYALCNLGGDTEPLPGVEILGRPTLENLVSQLRNGCDILYLVCHGRLVDVVQNGGGTQKMPQIWLEKEDSNADVVWAIEEVLPDNSRRPGLVDRLSNLLELPRLIVLASCQSGGSSDEWATSDSGELAALGPVLVEAGVPAVIAMQGDITMKTIEEFMPEFFKELLHEEAEGQIDRAVAAARGKVLNQNRTDWWVPTLYMRLKSGAIDWYEPRFAGIEADLKTWEGLSSAIKRGKCTPILGPGLIEFLVGSRKDIAHKWAVDDHEKPFPMSPHRSRSLEHVARYLATIKGDPFLPSTRLEKMFREEILRRHSDMLVDPEAPILQLIQVVGEKLREMDVTEIYRVLARLPVGIYINSNPDNLLYDALREANRKPRRALCPWNQDIEQSDNFNQFEIGSGYKPTNEEPLVYHLLGHLSVPESLVLSEDHYFDYLVWVSKDRTRGQDSAIPSKVSRALMSNSLMFFGFDIDDWNFRVLLHSLIDPLAGGTPGRPNSLAVQVTPKKESVLYPELACEYVEQYLGHFRNAVNVNVYWGTPQVFVRELWKRRSDWTPNGWVIE